ncbi:MAG TPA: chemotaxis response regulator protein-glutamate methylesterase [Moraxellaceae bacterium]|nr:chemotaxis response regulator protein-glutamate methylesterase [Moraxellaceae bacterium]
MSPIRVMIVDDTSAVRRVLTQVLEEETDISVVGTASNGHEALERLPRLAPDILLLDIEMPGMSGLELLRELRAAQSPLPVLLFSSLTERGAMVTIEALLLGARDYVTKPSMLGSAGAARDYIRRQVVTKLRDILGRGAGAPARAAAPVPATAPARLRAPVAPALPGLRPSLPGEPAQPVDAVVIAVSTGGPNALSEVIPALPGNLPVPVFIVQHMPTFFTQALARRLDQLSPLAVHECTAASVARPGQVWLAQGGVHMAVARRGDETWVVPDDGEPENFCRPSADVLFRTAVSAFGGRLLGVVMTGMGNDGLAGCREIRAAGGQVIVQDRDSSVVWGMPACVAEAGLAQQVLPLSALAPEIVRRVEATRPWYQAGTPVQAGVPA